MSKVSVNETMVKMKIVRERLGDLKALRTQVAVTERWMERDKISTPEYDVTAVDKKITELQLWLMDADGSIKVSNAITKIEIDADVEKLLEPIPARQTD